jgi:phage anti-repressor protein
MEDSKRLDIVQLINNSPLSTLSNGLEINLLQKIQTNFTDSQQQMFVASFYTFLHHDPKKDYVISLDDVWKWCGFSRKDHGKRLLNRHFTQNIDYKLFPRTEENLKNGRPIESILMTVNTFKKLCLKAGTKRADEIHDYYIKLEDLLHETLKEQLEHQKQTLQERQNQIQHQERLLDELKKKPDTVGFTTRRPGYNYVVKDISRPGHYKIGFAENTSSRLCALNTSSSTRSLEIVHRVFSKDKELSEKLIHNVLQPFRIRNLNQKCNEWFYFGDSTEFAFAIKTLNDCVDFTNQYLFEDGETFHSRLSSQKVDLDYELSRSSLCITENPTAHSDAINNFVSSQAATFHGVNWVEEKRKWKSEFQYNCKRAFLGYFADQIDAAKAYNDYALFLNENEGASLRLNEIPGYKTLPRNVPEINRMQEQGRKSSKYNGVSYDTKRRLYVAGIKFQRKTYNLGQHTSEIECAKLYNQQAMFFNNTFQTRYKLNSIENYVNVPNDLRDSIEKQKKTSLYFGVSKTHTGKWAASCMINQKKIHIGTFTTEQEACRAYNEKVIEMNKNGCTFKVNDTF